METLDVVTCGELLIDFVALDRGVSLAEATRFERAAGGAPANVAVGLARLGRTAGFLGQVGDDDFGHFLARTLRAEGVAINGLRFSHEARTSLAFVSLKQDGERDFMFYRHPSADMLWQATEEDLAIAANCRVFHHGSISLISEPSRSSTLAAIAAAKAAGALISFDPNLRRSLWPSEALMRDTVRDAIRRANIVKMSGEEFQILADCSDGSDNRPNYSKGAEEIWHDDLQLLIVTDGANGCHWFNPTDSDLVSGFAVDAVDTTGAGDAFMAGLLTGLLEHDLEWEPAIGEWVDRRRSDVERERPGLLDALRLANAAGALAVTRRGAIPALPTRAEIDAFLTKNATP
ncbi:MAG TPA: PfkB family carbohydrate kinase [Nitrolancea sp.]|nr:PfkB family carbohydrate kinase [Nitrolancea sp.]